ncbi:MAG: zinc ribbon domain-containing protein [Agathobacter sp.]|nr:zinc ribbon domain-containing protein [Agathobacter sp.]
MGFFDDMKGSISTVGMGLTQKATDMSGSAKLIFQIKEEEKKLEENKKEIGRIMFEQFPDEAKKLCPELYHDTTELVKKIANDKKELAVLKGMKICPNCGAEQDKEVINCTVCGMNMQEAARIISDMAPQDRFCPNCGQKLMPDAKFCGACGTQI